MARASRVAFLSWVDGRRRAGHAVCTSLLSNPDWSQFVPGGGASFELNLEETADPLVTMQTFQLS